mgnify:CR=1 FL=1
MSKVTWSDAQQYSFQYRTDERDTNRDGYVDRQQQHGFLSISYEIYELYITGNVGLYLGYILYLLVLLWHFQPLRHINSYQIVSYYSESV